MALASRLNRKSESSEITRAQTLEDLDRAYKKTLTNKKAVRTASIVAIVAGVILGAVGAVAAVMTGGAALPLVLLVAGALVTVVGAVGTVAGHDGVNKAHRQNNKRGKWLKSINENAQTLFKLDHHKLNNKQKSVINEIRRAKSHDDIGQLQDFLSDDEFKELVNKFCRNYEDNPINFSSYAESKMTRLMAWSKKYTGESNYSSLSKNQKGALLLIKEKSQDCRDSVYEKINAQVDNDIQDKRFFFWHGFDSHIDSNGGQFSPELFLQFINAVELPA